MTVETTSARIAPLDPPYRDDIAAALARWMPPAVEVEPLRLFRTLMVNPELAGRMRPLGAAILGSAALVPPRLREVMIQRTCALNENEYEWGVHAAAFGGPLGFTEEQIRSTAVGASGDECWANDESLVFAMAEQLHERSAISDDLWDDLAARFDPEQLIELLVIAGWYRTISYLCNALGIEAEPWARALPPARS